MKGIENLRIRQAPGGAILSVKVVPGSSRDRVVGVLGEAMKVATAAAAEKGKANAAVAGILAKALDVDKRAVEIVTGLTSPRKEFRVAGISSEQLREKLREL